MQGTSGNCRSDTWGYHHHRPVRKIHIVRDSELNSQSEGSQRRQSGGDEPEAEGVQVGKHLNRVFETEAFMELEPVGASRDPHAPGRE